MLPVSAISDAANKLRTLLSNGITDLTSAEIRIGHPKETLSGMAEDKHHLNLFYYNVTYDGYPADGLGADPLYVRLFCLITAVGAKSNGSVSTGENDLRLIGEVMRVLHVNPVLALDGGTGATVASLEVVPHPLNLDNLNHIWSTQGGDTAYRLSVAYEMALAPVPMTVPTQISPLTGDPQIFSWGSMNRSVDPEKQDFRSAKPEVFFLEIDITGDDWIPHICFVEKIDAVHKALHYVFKVTGDLNQPMDVLIAGKENRKVKMVWNVWKRKTDNSVVAWKADIPDTETPLEKEIKKPSGLVGPFFANQIDPETIGASAIFKVKLPDDVRQGDTKTWQAVLCATYEWSYDAPDGSGQIKTMIKSNPLMLYGDGS